MYTGQGKRQWINCKAYFKKYLSLSVGKTRKLSTKWGGLRCAQFALPTFIFP
jgi:hypothetical protein